MTARPKLRGVPRDVAADLEADREFWGGPAIRIEVRAGELPEAADKAQQALIKTRSGIFQRGGMLVRVARLGEAAEVDGIRRKAGSVVVVPVTRDYLILALARVVDWRKFDGRSSDWRRIEPPPGVAAALMAMAGEWKFPELAGVIAAPTLRADGSLLNVPGFDAASGLYLATSIEMPDIDPQPTRDDALAALETLRDLFSEFAFVSHEHASAALVALIAAGVRHALGIAPAYGFNAYAQSSGKTTLAQAIAQVWTGQDAPAMPLGDDEGELRKAILAALIAADPILLLDNIERPVTSATLCAVLTSVRFSDRVLGLSQRVTVPTSCTWLATGNNLQFQGDLTSRVIMTTIDPQMERPESRTFRRNLPDFIAEHRAELIRAALVIPLAYFAAGRPKIDGPASRFRGWDQFVRRPLMWLGCADPVATQDELRAGDDERGNLVALLTAWQEHFGDRAATVADAIAAATAPGMSARPRLFEALHGVADDRRGGVNARVLGRYLVRHLRRIEGGVRFEAAEADRVTHRRRFKVYGVTGVSGVSHVQRGANTNLGGRAASNAGNTSNAVSADCLSCAGEGCDWCREGGQS